MLLLLSPLLEGGLHRDLQATDAAAPPDSADLLLLLHTERSSSSKLPVY